MSELQAKTIEILCPVLSSGVTFPKDKKSPEAGNVHKLAKVSCLRGQCSWWNVGKQKCAVVVIAEKLCEVKSDQPPR